MFNVIKRRHRGRTAEQIHRQQRTQVARSGQDSRDPATSMLLRLQ